MGPNIVALVRALASPLWTSTRQPLRMSSARKIIDSARKTPTSDIKPSAAGKGGKRAREISKTIGVFAGGLLINCAVLIGLTPSSDAPGRGPEGQYRPGDIDPRSFAFGPFR